MILRAPDLLNLEPATDAELGRGHLSTTSIGTLLACQQRFHWHYEQRLDPAIRPVALEMGAAFAQAVEHGRPQLAWDQVIADHQAALDRFQGNPWVVVPTLREAEATAQVAREASRAYLTAYGSREVREHAMRVRIRNPRTGNPSLTFDLMCRVDGLDLDGRELIEDKLVNQIPRREGEMDRRLRLDRQVSIETYSIWRTTGVEIQTVRYRMTLKPAIRQKRDEAFEEYLERIAVEYATRPEHYLAEFECTRTPDDYVRLEAELWRWAEQLRQARGEGTWPRNTDACNDYGGCRFLALCSREPGAEHQFVERARFQSAPMPGVTEEEAARRVAAASASLKESRAA